MGNALVIFTKGKAMEENTHRFLASETQPCPPESAQFHIIPVPYEASVSYGTGTALGPEAILLASSQLEAIERAHTANHFVSPALYGFFTHPPVDCKAHPETVMTRITEAVSRAFSYNPKAIPIVLGGEHSVTTGALQALLAHTQKPFGILHFDAHADLRHTYENSPFSHACAMARATLPPPLGLGLPLAQFANRIFCQEELDTRKVYNIPAWDAENLHALLRQSTLPTLPPLLPPSFPQAVYISFDVDALDPSLMPATGTPVPGGLFWPDVMRLLDTLLEGRRILGFDVVELAPVDFLPHCDFTAAQLVHQLMARAVWSNSPLI